MGKINRDNLRKTIYYLKKNGVRNTVLAALERLQKKEYDRYTYVPPAEEVLQSQREHCFVKPAVFSIVVPLYRTPEGFFREMTESVLQQTYPHWELILADAGAREETGEGSGREEVTENSEGSENDEVFEKCEGTGNSGDYVLPRLGRIAAGYGDSRIRYMKLENNEGIAENTNQAILQARGDYVCLFDHDDLLTPDALYEMASALEHGEEAGITPVLLYSDEDKCSGDGSRYYEPHFKQDYDRDLLLTNNYFCHLTAVKTEVAKRLLLRGDYNGAQDFDFVLRATAGALPEEILHVPKVLYHWRCHTASTAANPGSKWYAYEAGKRAVEDYVNRMGWNAEVTHLKHLGYYRVNYRENVFTVRSDVGAVGGRLLCRGKIAGGMMEEDGRIVFEGLRDGYSGYVNRAALVQQADALDIRCMRIAPQCRSLAENILGVPGCIGADGQIVMTKLLGNSDYVNLSLRISSAIREAGYTLLWDPQIMRTMKEDTVHARS